MKRGTFAELFSPFGATWSTLLVTPNDKSPIKIDC